MPDSSTSPAGTPDTDGATSSAASPVGATPGDPQHTPGARGADPFAARSDLPYGLPPFDRIHEETFLPAFEAAVAEHLAEVEAIAGLPMPPTFEDTVEALERAGQRLARVTNVLFNLTSSVLTPGLQSIEADVAPRLAAHLDAVQLNPRLFARIADLHSRRDELALDAEQLRLLDRYHSDLVRAGAALSPDEQSRLRELNQELSALTTAFKNDLVAGTNELAVHVPDAARLTGMPAGDVEAAAEAARARGLDGYLLPLVLPTQQPVLELLTDRELRREVFEASVRRGLGGTRHDTRATLTRLVALRAERAALLGYATHADYVVADQTAGSLDAVTDMLARLVPPAVANARAEAAELEKELRHDGVEGPLMPWDWAFYAERVRRRRFDVDATALRPWFELHRVVHDGVFAAASALYGLRFTRRADLPVYHPDVEVYEVTREDGEGVGLFLADWYARESKHGGAWMNSFVRQSRLLGQRPVVVINLNVPKPRPGEPTLLTLDEVKTAFHEFGHVLHGLLSSVTYPRFAGTSVPRDFVEFPSQVNEMWAWYTEVTARYAVHHETGEPLPAEELIRLLDSLSYGQGFATTEYLAAALLDLEWHRLAPEKASVPPEDVEAFERAALERHGIALEHVPPRYRSSYFAHIFAGGYSAGYYSYIWSEVLDADLVEWFGENGGLRRENGRRFAEGLLSRGGSVDPMAAFAEVRGRGPSIEPLLARRQLV